MDAGRCDDIPQPIRSIAYLRMIWHWAILEDVGAEFGLGPETHFNPWTATRIATVWFERELLNAGGDVDLATRAYHRGLGQALDEKGDAYLARVQRLRSRYIRAPVGSAYWKFLAREISQL